MKIAAVKSFITLTPGRSTGAAGVAGRTGGAAAATGPTRGRPVVEDINLFPFSMMLNKNKLECCV